ncbi:hypothetical protein LR48_Vigan03g095400 [Vigna angularis]|uniref:Uncharacterized protein n=1 Tax=Phaseolus angularis TaxID=3914 RepID=A0A0L9U4H9_PHAAN|nr:hypothetical protein LR48_Vigan03g095400 [Vigna angularis]
MVGWEEDAQTLIRLRNGENASFSVAVAIKALNDAGHRNGQYFLRRHSGGQRKWGFEVSEWRAPRKPTIGNQSANMGVGSELREVESIVVEKGKDKLKKGKPTRYGS